MPDRTQGESHGEERQGQGAIEAWVLDTLRQATTHVQASAEGAARHHDAQATARAGQRNHALRRAFLPAIRGAFGHEPSAQQASDLREEADAHDRASAAHQVASLLFEVLGAGAEWFREDVLGDRNGGQQETVEADAHPQRELEAPGTHDS